jgi:hypothetical protein
MWRSFAFLLLLTPIFADEPHPTLTLGSAAPTFSLPGIDGKTHKLKSWFSFSPVTTARLPNFTRRASRSWQTIIAAKVLRWSRFNRITPPPFAWMS